MTQPIIFLDFDDVLALNVPGGYGGFDVVAPNPPDEMWLQLFNAPAVETLLAALAEHDARVVITTSWLRFMLRDAFETIFARTGLDDVGARLHDAWEAPQNHGDSRVSAIERWLAKHHKGERYVILDDVYSGTGLKGSLHDRSFRVVLCQVGVGLHAGHLPAIRKALADKHR